MASAVSSIDRRQSPPRRGYTLVFFAMLLFALMALAALVIDLGLVRLTQRQMKVATDGAAVEGLRERDLATEMERRQMVREHVAWTFDDNFDTDDDSLNLGAGPQIVLQPGIGGELQASQFIFDPDNPSIDPNLGSLPDPPVHKPAGLELNLDDAAHGDMVAGRYDFDEFVGERPAQFEEADYTRSDFMPKSAISGVPGNDHAFLVRLRRTNNIANLDAVSGVSSNAPALPYLFGRGAMLPTVNEIPDSDYLPRSEGVTIRATSIADAVPAISIGAPQVSPPVAGALPVAVELELLRAAISGNTPIPAQQYFDIQSATTDPTIRVIGEVAAPTAATVLDQTGFVGVFVENNMEFDQIDRHVVAYTFGTFDAAGSFTPEASQLVYGRNVSGVFLAAPNPDSPIASISKFRKTLRGETGIVHAPVSVR